MSKFIIARTVTIRVINYHYGIPLVQIDTPVSYSLCDMIQMIKMWTKYADIYDWEFSNPEESGSKTLSLKNDRAKMEDTEFDVYRKGSPYIICKYGPIAIELGARGFIKYRKVYPTIYQAVGYFPTEEEYVKNISVADIDGKYTVPMKTLPSASHSINNELVEYGEKMKEFFKNKYQISNEIVEDSPYNENKLIKK